MLTFQIYKDHAGQWRWRLRARNGKIVADSGESYKERESLDHAIELITTEIGNSNYVIEEED
jgi:uncharacterized protein YegP (UPF0339 family)